MLPHLSLIPSSIPRRIAGGEGCFLGRYPRGDNFDPHSLKFFETEVRKDQYQRLISYPAMYHAAINLSKPPYAGKLYDFLHQYNHFDDSRLNSVNLCQLSVGLSGPLCSGSSISFWKIP
jgi:hypothetical protein